MSTSKGSHSGKTTLHGRPVGEITQEDIEQRAGELAEIQGRDAAAAQPVDHQQATEELSGLNLPDAITEDDQSIGSLTRDPSDPPVFYGKATPTRFEPSEQEDLEHLVLDGVEEAQHDQMLEARKRRQS